MSWSESLYSWLAYSALVSLAVLALGSVAALLCRQPARRLRIIELSLAGCLIVPWLGMIPGYPRLAIAWLHVGTGPFFGDKAVFANKTLAENMDMSPSMLIDKKTPLADDRLAENPDLPPSTDRGANLGTGPLFAEKTPLADPRLAENPDLIPSAASVADLPSAPTAESVEPIETPAQAWDLASWAVALYLSGVTMGILWWMLGVAALLRILWTAKPAPPRYRRLLMQIAGRRGDRVRLLTSRLAKQPFASAWWWPQKGTGPYFRTKSTGSKSSLAEKWTNPRLARATIVLPKNLGDDEQAVRWALAHEWSHIERHDFPAWLAADLARVLFFYQPLVWWLRRQLRLCQDFVADAGASRQAPQPEDYAEFLTHRATAGSLHPAMVGLGMGFRKSELYRRIVMLVQNPPLDCRVPRLWTVSVTCAALILVAVVAALSVSPQASAQGDPAAQSEPSEPIPPPVGPAPVYEGEPSTVQLPQGVTVELLGVGEKSLGWWNPNGKPFSSNVAPPFNWGTEWGATAGQIHRAFVLRVKSPMDQEISQLARSESGECVSISEPLLTVEGMPGQSAHMDRSDMRDGIKKVETIDGRLHGSFPEKTAETKVVLGLTFAWKTISERDTLGRAIGKQAGGDVVAPNPALPDQVLNTLQMKDKTFITLEYKANKESDIRIVAIDQDDKPCLAKQIVLHPDATPPTATWVFETPAERIKKFQIQKSPYTWVEFRDVSLQPGHKTQVAQIVDGKDAAKSAPATPEKEKAPEQESSTAKKVEFVVGPNKFANKEDKITIEEVRSELGTLAKGDTVTVKGTYTLASRPKATLVLSVTRIGPGTETGTSIRMEEGTAPFDMKIRITSDGYLHMGFFSLETGRSFGNLLFGTETQIKGIAHWTLEGWMGKPGKPDAPSDAKKQAHDDIDVRYMKAAYEVAKAKLERSLKANTKFPNTVSDETINEQRLEVEKLKILLEKAKKDLDKTPLRKSPTAKKVDFAIGPNKFAEGDKITIEEVWSELGTLDKNDTVTVKGTYTLASHPKAKLCLYVTEDAGKKPTNYQPTTILSIEAGTSTFEFTRPIVCEGHLHLGLYPEHSGSWFGNVYFGTESQMKEITSWKDWEEKSAKSDSPSDTTSADAKPVKATAPFTAKFPNGITVELLGVSENPSKDKPWWRPDGLPLTERPYEQLGGQLGGIIENHIAREIAVRLSPVPSERVGLTWQFDPTCTALCQKPSNAGTEMADIHGFGLRVPADRKTVTFRLGIADGPWELSGETDGRGNGSSLGVDGKEIVFFGAFEKDENVIIHIAHNITGSDLRVIALGKDGKEYSSGLTQVGGGKINKISAKFAKVTLKDIQAFRLQARPYQWVEFRNISLQPGQKTNVQVVQPDTPKSSDKPE